MEGKTAKQERAEQKFADVLHQCNNIQSRSILKAKESLSSWLTALRVAKDHFNLSANEFHDGLALRYGKPLIQLSPLCNGYGAQIPVSHALDCRKGALVMQRHNEIRDVISDLAGRAWNQITREPVIRNASESSVGPALIADLGVRGVCQTQAVALFDVRAIDTDAQSYRSHTPQSVLGIAEDEKKREYSTASEEKYASFTPPYFSVDGLLEVKPRHSSRYWLRGWPLNGARITALSFTGSEQKLLLLCSELQIYA